MRYMVPVYQIGLRRNKFMVDIDTVDMDKAVKKISPELLDIIDKEREKHHLDTSFKIKDIKKEFADVSGDIRFLEMSDKDLYRKIKLPLFSENVYVLGGLKTKTGENAIRTRRVNPEYDRAEYVEHLEYDIPEIGLVISDHGILDVSIKDIEDALVRNKKIIERMESTFEDELTIFLRSGMDCKELIEGVVDLTSSLDAKNEEYYPDKNAIEFIWSKWM